MDITMDIEKLAGIMKEFGIAGAGGAGFPAYAKLDNRTDTIILNCAECEPLLKVHRQLLEKYSYEILFALDILAKTIGAGRVIIAIKDSYKRTVEAVRGNLDLFNGIEISILPEMYPAGDEVITIYETTKRIVPPGKIPIEVGVVVFNVETVYNIYCAIHKEEPTIYKYVTIAGEIKNPCTLKVPIGTTINRLVELAGKSTVNEPRFILGGPMTGNVVDGCDVIKKTTNAVLVLPQNHSIINKKLAKTTISMKRAMSACCQCRMCTDLCPRYLIGYPVQPNKFMRLATSGVLQDNSTYIESCSQCGLCEFYACAQELLPRKLIGEFKERLKNKGIHLSGSKLTEVSAERENRKVPIKRLIERLGLKQYDVLAPLIDEVIETDFVKISLNQSIGVLATSVVECGEIVKAGQIIGKIPKDKLGVFLHAPISGIVQTVNDKFITIKNLSK